MREKLKQCYAVLEQILKIDSAYAVIFFVRVVNAIGSAYLQLGVALTLGRRSSLRHEDGCQPGAQHVADRVRNVTPVISAHRQRTYEDLMVSELVSAQNSPEVAEIVQVGNCVG